MKHTAPASPVHPAILSATLAEIEIESLMRPDGEPSAEERVWRAVIVQAIMDARSTSTVSGERIAREAARAWFGTSDFYAVCDRAGLDPDYALARAIRALDPNFNWRKRTGQGWRVKNRHHAEGNA